MVDKLAFIRKHGNHVDPTNTRQVNRKYNQLKRVPWYLEQKATAKQRKILKERGHRVTDKGVIVDGPRNKYREKIPGSKMSIGKDGTIKWTITKRVKQRDGSYKQITASRRDFIVGLTAAEKKEFALDPQAFIDKKLAELKERYPTLARRAKIQVRLQWGAYQATKDFSPNVFGPKYLHKWMPKEQEHKLDKLTGLHFVIHVRKGK
jgi:hypothetical protein